MLLINFSRYFGQRRRFFPPGAFTFPTSSFHVRLEMRSVLFVIKYDKIISYDEQSTLKNMFFSKHLKIEQNTAQIEVDF